MKPYRTPIKNREVIDQAVSEMLDANVIKRSRSPWSFPVVIVDKKDGSERFYVDFRKLNQIIKKNSYLLPLKDDIFALLGKAKFLTTLDLKSGYLQVAMEMKKTKKRLHLLVTKGYLSLMSCHLVFQMPQQFFKSS